MNLLNQKRHRGAVNSNPNRPSSFLDWKIVGILLLVLTAAGCYTVKLEEAFKGKLASHESNKIILDYCKSCHLHKDFDSSLHVEEMSLQYKRKVFRYATECRVCHFVKKRWYLNDYIRKTRRPTQANGGQYEKFERDYLRWQKDSGELPTESKSGETNPNAPESNQEHTQPVPAGKVP